MRMKIRGVKSNSVILYHSAIFETAIVPCIWKEPLVMQLKQLRELRLAQCFHRTHS